MMHPPSSQKDAAYIPQKIKQANEKQFSLRKKIYDIARLSYEKGTRSEDYVLRKIVLEINGELDSCDNQIRILEINDNTSLTAYKEFITFFESIYLDRHIIKENITQLKLELANQQNTELQYNIEHKQQPYKRNPINPYREELRKDLNKLEGLILTVLSPDLSDFLIYINELFFNCRVNEIIRDWAVKYQNNEAENNLNHAINGFLEIFTKIKTQVFTEKDALTLVNSCLTQSGLKYRILHLKNMNENKLDTIILESVVNYSSRHSEKEKNLQQVEQEKAYQQQNIPGKLHFDKSNNLLENTLLNLKYLVEFRNKTNIDTDSVGRTSKYLYNCPDSGKILLKDVADYLKDSLIFIIDWLYIDLKKNPDLLSTYILFIECLPDIIKFYDLLNTTDITAAQTINQKKNMWGEIEQFISANTANTLVDIMRSLRLELKDAFVKSIIEIEMNKSASFSVILKKINIIYDSYDNAQKKITSEMNKLKL